MRKDLKGRRFGKLVVVARTTSSRPTLYRGAWWDCICTCGTKKTIRTGDLTSGRTVSCGCHKNEMAARRMRNQGTHNESRRGNQSPEYKVWANIRKRCLNPSSPLYKRYGAKGITICDRWTNSFENFLADMGRRPSLKHSIDRKRNGEGYSPKNCRWATAKEQVNNRTNTLRITYKNETKTVKAWADTLGINYYTLRCRIRSGWSVEKALTKRRLI